MVETRRTIRIPLEPDSVVIFADELPVGDLDYNDIIDVLRSVLAPLKLWRSCAVEYHRQGFRVEFDQVLTEIIDSLADPYVEKIYRERLDYKEGMAEIFNALAAKELGDLARFKDSAINSNNRDETDCERRVVDYLGRAETQIRGHSYSCLIKGFYEIRQGEVDRAEANFKTVYNTANASKKEYMFGALVGLGIVAYSKEKYAQAVEHFSKALQKHPKSLSSIRVVIASCCFKLKQFDRARAILEKALANDPSNADVLVLLALLEQVAAQKDRSKRLECRAHAYEYCLLAREMETSIPSTMMAQTHMANHYFHTWKTVISGQNTQGAVRILVRDQWQVELEGDAKELEIRVNDPFKINTSHFTVKSVTTLASSNTDQGQIDRILISLAGKKPIESTLVGATSESSSLKVEVKQYGLVHSLATDVMKKTTVNAVKAESIYIIGRLFHAQNNIASAIEYYKVAYRICPNLSLALFGHAQIMLAKQDLVGALDLFERVLVLSPDDRDTNAYVLLVRALLKQESSSLDKVKEVATGFLHEVDLWLVQGQIRHTKKVPEYASALRCYAYALECMEQNVEDVGAGARSTDPFIAEYPRVLSNMAVLNHSLGKPSVSLEFCRRALIAQQVRCNAEEEAEQESGTAAPRVENPPFKNQQFEGIFFSWSSSICSVKPDWSAPGWESIKSDESGGSSSSSSSVSSLTCTFQICDLEGSDADTGGDATLLFSVGNELLLQEHREGSEMESPVLHVVLSVTPRGFITRSHVHRALLVTSAERATGPVVLSVKRKVPGSNFSDSSITTSYNYARILEDLGHTIAAKEVYVQLLKHHPSFIDCYLRLSRIARDVGRLDEASVWVSRALTVEEKDCDAGVCLGDLYAGGQKWEEAKKCYEKNNTKENQDPRTLLSLGNMYFANLSTNPERYIKDSYKFFHRVLTDDAFNVYAANGLGIVCAEKGEFDVAREIITRAREAGMPHSEDISCNLAHVYIAQGRLVDAEHLYQAVLKTLPRSSSSRGGSTGKSEDKIVTTYECMAFAQFRNARHLDSLHSLLRGLHRDPSGLRGWYNVATVRADLASTASKKKLEKVEDIEDASQQLLLAYKLFRFLSNQNHPHAQRGEPHSTKTAGKRLVTCELNIKIFAGLLERAKAEEELRNEERLRQEEEHRVRLQLKQDELSRMRQVAEDSKRDQQLIAVARQKKLEELREKWTQGPAAPASSSVGKSEGGPAKKRNKKKVVATVGEDGEDDDDSGNEAPSSPLDYLDNDVTDEQKKSKKNIASSLDDIFGSDDSDDDVDEAVGETSQPQGDVDDDDDSSSVIAAKQKSESKGKKTKGKRKGNGKIKGRKLKRSRADSDGGSPVAAADDDDDELFGDETGLAADGELPPSKRRSRVIGEDNEED